MFGFGRKRARDIAARLGRTMVIIRDASRGADLQALANAMESHGYVRIEVDSRDHGPVAGWTEGPQDDADMVYYVASYLDPDGKTIFQAVAEGYEKLAGLILVGGVGDITVGVSDILKATGELGSDTITFQKELLAFPGFSTGTGLWSS